MEAIMKRHLQYRNVTAWILIISYLVSLNVFFINVNSKEMFSDEGYRCFILEEEKNYCSDLSGLYTKNYILLRDLMLLIAFPNIILLDF